MVFLATSREGLFEALSLAEQNNDTVWCTSSALTETEFDAMNTPNLTRLDYSFTSHEAEALADAIVTINEHHPGERIWIEGSDNEC